MRGAQQGCSRARRTHRAHAGINFFMRPDDPLYLVDMPGYGFAKAPKEKGRAVGALVRAYLRVGGRRSGACSCSSTAGMASSRRP